MVRILATLSDWWRPRLTAPWPWIGSRLQGDDRPQGSCAGFGVGRFRGENVDLQRVAVDVRGEAGRVLAVEHGLPHHPDRDPGRIALASEHPDQPAEGRLGTGRRDPSGACGRRGLGQSRASVVSSSSSSASPTTPESTPLRRSSPASARRASPRPWWRLVTHARAKAPSSTIPTSLYRSRTSSATSAGMPRRRSTWASSARV